MSKTAAVEMSDRTFEVWQQLTNNYNQYNEVERIRAKLGLAYPTPKPFNELRVTRFANAIKRVWSGSPVGVSFLSIARDWLE